MSPQEEKIREFIISSENHAKNNGFRVNPDKAVVERLAKGMIANEERYGKKYCPCRRISGNLEADSKNICPCYYHRGEIEKDGHCLCMLFVK